MNLLEPETLILQERPVTLLRSDAEDITPVILLHGGGLDCASLSWRALLPVLAEKRTVIAPDWPGYGGSGAQLGRHSIADLSAWLIALMDRLQIEHADLVGISMGGGTALQTALDAPDRVRSLVLAGTYGVQEKAPNHLLTYLMLQLPINTVSYALLRRSRWLTRKMLESIFANPERVSDALVDEVMHTLADSDSAKAFTQFQRSEISLKRMGTVLIDQLPMINQPTLFIQGREDSLISLPAIQRAAQQMPDARVEVLEAGHWPMRECPERFNRLVFEFLEDRSRR